MKKKILALGMIVALLAVMALPMAVFAAGTPQDGITVVTGILGQTLTLKAPSAFNLGLGGNLALGINTGSSGTPGSVVTNAAGWLLAVADKKTITTGFMTKGGDDVLGDKLATAIQVSIDGVTPTNISGYLTQLAIGTGLVGTTPIPLYASQTVIAATDLPGTYSITLTYTATPGY